MSNELLTSIIVAFGGVVAAFITVRVRRSRPRSQYIDTAFDAYEKIMKRQDMEIDELKKERAELIVENAKLRKGAE